MVDAEGLWQSISYDERNGGCDRTKFEVSWIWHENAGLPFLFKGFGRSDNKEFTCLVSSLTIGFVMGR